MTDALDARLQSLFAEKPRDLEDEAFTSGVLAQARNKRYGIAAGLLSVALILVASAWFLALPIQGFAQIISETLTVSLLDLGTGWTAFLLAPINNIASVLILGTKAILILRKKIMNATFVN